MSTLPADADLIPAGAQRRLDALAARYARAGGLGLQVLNLVGGQAENLLDRLPEPVRSRLDGATERALRIAFDAATASRTRVPDQGQWLDRAMTTAMGAAGGFGGLPSALAELPVTTTLLLRTIQGVAAEHGFDPRDEDVAFECLSVFAAAGPLEHDDGANMAFLTARVTLSGATVHGLISKVAPRLATAMGQKLAAQTVPIIGAAAGAATNYAYTSYYQEMAQVHFGLKTLSRDHTLPQDVVLGAFRARLEKS